jgi:hypothetical protein
MKRVHLFQKAGAKSSAAFFFIFCFLLSLSLPYSSEYFSQDDKVITRATGKGIKEKVEVSTNFHASPAECLTLKRYQSGNYQTVPGRRDFMRSS